MDVKKRTQLKLFRVGKHLTQEQFAEKIGYSRWQYVQFESGKGETTLRFLEALTQAFGITFDEAKAISKRDNE